MFVFVHIPPIFSVLLTHSLKINSLLFFDPPRITLFCNRCNIEEEAKRENAKKTTTDTHTQLHGRNHMKMTHNAITKS